MADDPTSFAAYGLVPPSKLLVPAWEPLRHQGRISAAEEMAARGAAMERAARLQERLDYAREEWRQYFDRYYANRPARAVFDIHQPEQGYERVVCQECREADCDDTVGVEWPCATFSAMKAAADG